MLTRWAVPLLLGAVALAYANAFYGVFQFDDFNNILEHAAVTHWPPDLSGLRPLLKLTYALNWQAGPNEFGFHLVNIGVHALNTLLVFALARLIARPHLDTDTATRAALIGSLLFAVHPVHTEAVTYISGRSSSLMSLFYLLSLLAYIRGRINARRMWMYALSPLCFALALLSKETALTLPLVLLSWEAVYGQGKWRARLRGLGGHWAIVGLAVFAVMLHPAYREMLAFAPTTDTLRTQIHGITYLLSRWGLIHELNIDPDLPVQTAWTTVLLIQATALLGLLIFGLRSLRRRPWWGLGILWLFIHLLPGNSVILRWDVANERQLYLAGIGLFIALGIELAHARHRFTAIFITTSLALAIAVLVLFTALRNHDYGSEVRLWEATARLSPNKARVFNNLGQAYTVEGKLDQARASYQRALELDPVDMRALNNLRALNRDRRH